MTETDSELMTTSTIDTTKHNTETAITNTQGDYTYYCINYSIVVSYTDHDRTMYGWSSGGCI